MHSNDTLHRLSCDGWENFKYEKICDEFQENFASFKSMGSQILYFNLLEVSMFILATLYTLEDSMCIPTTHFIVKLSYASEKNRKSSINPRDSL